MKSFVLIVAALFCTSTLRAQSELPKSNPLGGDSPAQDAQNPPTPIPSASPQSVDETAKPQVENNPMPLDPKNMERR
jgi:hypothetical protein